MKILILTDSDRYTTRRLADELSSMGIETRLMNISEEPMNPNIAHEFDKVVLVSMNPYIALAVASILPNTVNSFNGILNSLSIPRLLSIQKIDFTLVSGDVAVGKAVSKPPYYFNTTWGLGLGGFIDTVEGARSVFEYRRYMKNPLASSSVLVNMDGVERRVYATSRGDFKGLMEALNLAFAELVLVGNVAVEVNPTPEIPPNKVKETAEAIVEYG